MATVDEGLFDYLRRSGSLRTLVGDQIYPRGEVDPNATLPRVTYLLVSTMRSQVLAGATTGKGSLFQIDCWAGDKATAKAVAAAVSALFEDGYRGPLGESGITSKGTIVVSESDDDEQAAGGAETGICRVRLDVRIHHAA